MVVPIQRPTESFAAVIRVIRICSMLVGCDVSRPDYQINWVTGVTIIASIGYYVFTGFTIFVQYKENPFYALEASCMLGTSFQALSKLVSAIAYSKKFSSLCFELEKIYEEYQKEGPKYCKVLHQSCHRSMRIIKLIGLVQILCALGMMSTPFIMIFFTGRRYLILNFLIPYVDVKTNVGYFGTLAAHSICVFLAAFGLFAGDLFVLIFLSHGFLFVDIFKLKIEELNSYMEESFEIVKLREMLKDLSIWHQKYNTYSINCNDTFFYIITVQVTASGYSILCTLYTILRSDWPSGFAYIVSPIEALYIYCILGTQIEICNDSFIDEVYNINWYNMPVAEQKMIRFMLMKCQSPAQIEIAGFVPLTVNTAIKITNSIYSTFMMMLQFLNDA